MFNFYDITDITNVNIKILKLRDWIDIDKLTT